ncbi:MAG: hypothetical protein IKW04_00190 [Clostridia bacterium]|nr:hypothetical protein [Clostridia bacterium]
MKKLFSLLLVVAMFASMSVVSFAATGTNDVSWEIVETADGITATYYITNPKNVSGFTAAIAFDATKVAADKNTPYTLGADFAGTTVSPGSKAGNVKFAQTFGTATDRYVTKTGKIECLSFNFTRVDADADLSNAFSYGTSLYVAKIASPDGELTSAKAAANFAAPVYIDNRAPIVTNPFSATATGTTITCIGKVEATVENYGVVFTAESTVEGARAQKYYGAMDGDTVKDYNGSTTFTFGDWTGEFEIILEGVHAGTKTLSFFANDTVIEGDTTFTVTVE